MQYIHNEFPVQTSLTFSCSHSLTGLFKKAMIISGQPDNHCHSLSLDLVRLVIRGPQLCAYWFFNTWTLPPVPPLPPRQSPRGGRGCVTSPLSVEPQSCHWIPLYSVLSCFSVYSHCSFCLVFFVFFLRTGPSSWLHSTKNFQCFLFRQAFWYGSCFATRRW